MAVLIVGIFIKVEKELEVIGHDFKVLEEKFAKDEPQIEKAALATIAVLTPAIVAVLSVYAPEAAPLIPPIAARIQAGLAALNTVVTQSGTAQPTVASIVNGIVAQLKTFEQVAGIKDAKTQAEIGSVLVSLQSIVDVYEPVPLAPALPASLATQPATPAPVASSIAAVLGASAAAPTQVTGK